MIWNRSAVPTREWARIIAQISLSGFSRLTTISATKWPKTRGPWNNQLMHIKSSPELHYLVTPYTGTMNPIPNKLSTNIKILNENYVAEMAKIFEKVINTIMDSTQLRKHNTLLTVRHTYHFPFGTSLIPQNILTLPVACQFLKK